MLLLGWSLAIIDQRSILSESLNQKKSHALYSRQQLHRSRPYATSSAVMPPFKINNKIKRGELYLKQKKERENIKRDERHKRRRHEEKNPHLREERRAKHIPVTIDKKRIWDDAAGDDDGALGLSIDVLNPKRQKLAQNEEQTYPHEDISAQDEHDDQEEEDDVDSMLDTDEEDEDEQEDDDDDESLEPADRAPSEAPSTATSTATDLALTPESLSLRFPRLFDPPPDYDPKVLITTSINSTLHTEAELLTTLFPNSKYIKRTAHFHSYKFSIREISKFAAARDYTHVIILNQHLHKKTPSGLDIVFLPMGPMFHFTISNWIPGARLPGHGNPTNHYPEMILNGFKTPLGLLAAHLFKSLFPSHPEIQGRQVVTLHNQRDYIFVRRHRYVFRDKRGTEKSIQGVDGKPVKGVEEIRAGLQELGPRFTLKLRRIDKGIQRLSGQEWEWKAHDEKVRTRFNL